MVALMRMKSQEDNSHRYHHLIPFERVDLCTNCRMLDNRKASVGYTMIKLAAKASCVSSWYCIQSVNEIIRRTMLRGHATTMHFYSWYILMIST